MRSVGDRCSRGLHLVWDSGCKWCPPSTELESPPLLSMMHLCFGSQAEMCQETTILEGKASPEPFGGWDHALV
ncbi:unnamed protein product [Gulo gulo]|uniref:Uncharacterized protein n=1 Tax=Gulo gulo TaxID=48420 RepID=A0A9X9PWB6_GULGU|nr:unnamed protein product [Gulo gulo]